MVIEHKGAGNAERVDDFSSVAYWYQTESHKPFPTFPSAQERLYGSHSIIVEGESLLDNAEASAGKPIQQKSDGWSGGAQLFYTPLEAPASVTVKFNVPKAGKYTVLLQYTKSFDYGIYQAYLDGAKAGKAVDLYNDAVTQAPAANLGTHDLTAGEHELKFETTSKNGASKGYYFGLDFVELMPIG